VGYASGFGFGAATMSITVLWEETCGCVKGKEKKIGERLGRASDRNMLRQVE
jgi:hypothetical protein